jgi:hypothetical protein
MSRVIAPVTIAASVVAALVVAACSGQSPSSPSVLDQPSPGVSAAGHAGHFGFEAPSQPPGQSEEKGYIKGWSNGEEVELYYTKAYFCAEPPVSGASTSDCELGADALVVPREGPIPTIYAIAAAGITPDVNTLSCPPGSTCLNHPSMIDASRVLGPGATSIPGVPHSHIVTERRGGWFHTVNIRVRDLGAWNQIAAAKTLDKVRELQADPNYGGKGLVSPDTPTNIFFFIASWR